MPLTPQHAHDADVEERAAILQFDAGLSRPDAERTARRMVAEAEAKAARLPLSRGTEAGR